MHTIGDTMYMQKPETMSIYVESLYLMVSFLYVNRPTQSQCEPINICTEKVIHNENIELTEIFDTYRLFVNIFCLEMVLV